MTFSSYEKVTGVIRDIRSGGSCCSLLISVDTDGEIVNFVVSGDTIVVDNTRLRRGIKVAAFYDTSLPAPAIFPPQYQAELVTALRAGQDVALKFFDDTLTAEDGSLKLNLSPVTNIRTLNGQRFMCSPEGQDLLVYCSYILVAAVAFYLYRTRAGLFMRALGENPAAVDAVGVNVFGLRYLYVIMGGALAGLGGAYLSLAYAPCWLENMTAGRGWIAVALVIFALWDPWRALLGSYLFGGIDALGFHLQVVGLPVSVFILNMLPYILTIVVLILVLARKGGRLAAPQALGQPYDREER